MALRLLPTLRGLETTLTLLHCVLPLMLKLRRIRQGNPRVGGALANDLSQHVR